MTSSIVNTVSVIGWFLFVMFFVGFIYVIAQDLFNQLIQRDVSFMRHEHELEQQVVIKFNLDSGSIVCGHSALLFGCHLSVYEYGVSPQRRNAKVSTKLIKKNNVAPIKNQNMHPSDADVWHVAGTGSDYDGAPADCDCAWPPSCAVVCFF